MQSRALASLWRATRVVHLNMSITLLQRLHHRPLDIPIEDQADFLRHLFRQAGKLGLVGQRLSQGKEALDVALDSQIAHKNHRGVGDHLRNAPAEAAIGHIVLHNLDGVGIDHLHAGHLVEGDQVPIADQPYLAPSVVVEKGDRADLAARDEDVVGQHLTKGGGLAGAARPTERTAAAKVLRG
jgi:hypothetical protein